MLQDHFSICTILIFITFDNRQARGEDLQGLNLEELQQLEKKLEAGLRRVLETKVCARLLISFMHVIITCWGRLKFKFIGKKMQNRALWFAFL